MSRPTSAGLLAVLQSHIGAENGVDAQQLCFALNCNARVIRELVTELREAGVAVCGRPETGYFIARTQQELEETCAFLRARALHSLTLESKLRGMPLADLVGQLHLKT